MKKSIIYKLVKNTLLITIIIVASVGSAQTEVIGLGYASGDSSNARERALTDALRDAVQKGAGIDILANTQITNYALDFDRVFTSAFGYVKNYRVLSQGMEDEDTYTVKISANVGKGAPGADDLMALKMLVRSKESPRVLIESNEYIEGIRQTGQLLQGLLTEMALKSEMQIIDRDQTKNSSDRRARRDAFFDDDKTATFRRADITSTSDFIIRANSRGNYVASEKIYGLETHRFSFGVDLSAIWADTGEVIAEVSLPSTDVNSSMGSPEQAARDSISRLIAGELPVSKSKSALTLFRRIVVKWVTELDLGKKMKLEFARIDSELFDKALAGLGSAAGVGYVWGREFDAKGMSMIEVESRLNANQLKDEVLRHIGSEYKLDRHTRNYLQFVPSAVKVESKNIPEAVVTVKSTEPPVTQNVSEEVVEIKPDLKSDITTSQSEIQNSKSSFPPWAWALIGAGGFGILFGVYSLGKKSS